MRLKSVDMIIYQTCDHDTFYINMVILLT